MTDILDDFIEMEHELTAVKEAFAPIVVDLRPKTPFSSSSGGPKKGPHSFEEPEVWRPEKYVDSPGLKYDLCVYSRDPECSCSKCADACPTDAIGFKDNHIWILRDKCIGCGCCAGVCPNGAIFSSRVIPDKFAEEFQAAAATGNQAFVTCYKALDDLPPAGLLVVPCIGAIPAETWFSVLAAYRNIGVYLPDCICDDCEVITGEEVYEDAIDKAENWTHRVVGFEMDEEQMNLSMKRSVERKKFIQRMLQGSFAIGSYTSPRVMAVKKAYEQFQINRAKVANLNQMLNNIVRAGQVDQFMTPQRKTFLAAVKAHPEMQKHIRIPVCRSNENCVVCEKCIYNCPMGARKKVNGEMRTIACYCTGCGACVDMCEHDGCVIMPASGAMIDRELKEKV
ncbi:MAG: 4Fe-4S binding protein [Coriobacteriales bacterium]|nr:4Fe-4S binding protein [Coriobacteriales bacterium]MBQ6587007.1 4Fe-4S binding protein [Coriobacteriales bacterium]